MKEKTNRDFKEWWDEEDTAIKSGEKPMWEFNREIIDYCIKDVEVLRKAWLIFEVQMSGRKIPLLEIPKVLYKNMRRKVLSESIVTLTTAE